jgi:hypothetical protein
MVSKYIFRSQLETHPPELADFQEREELRSVEYVVQCDSDLLP